MIIFFTIITTSIRAKKTYVPDDNFEQALIYLGYDSGPLDNYVITQNISEITNLNISYKDIRDLTGIEDFTSLTILFCNNNYLESLDLSANTALTNLDCHSNYLTKMDLRNGNNANISSFKATDNPYLTCIFVDDKMASYLSSWLIDATADFINTETECNTITYVPDDNFELALINIGYDIGPLDDYVPTNNIDNIINLSINNKNIKDLTGIEDFSALTELNCGSNQLTSLDVSANTDLTVLYCEYNQLTNLDVSTNTNLTKLYCNNNKLTSLDLLTNTDLTKLYCFYNKLTSLNISDNATLKSLYCYNNQLTNLDVSSDTVLAYLDCRYNQLTSIDISGCTNLTDLWCDYNKLTNISVSTNTKLSYLVCSYNQLASLDVSDNVTLKKLYCYNNQLTNLDVSSNTVLTYLDCSYNQLASLDVSGCTDLTKIKCFYNQLTNINVSTNAELSYLVCSYNQLASLDVSDNVTLKNLYCNNNKLKSLDVSNNITLTNLYCNNNILKSLDVRNGNNANFERFAASNNPFLSCIYIDDNTASYLSCWVKDAIAKFVNSEEECTTTSINEITEQFYIYPNPTNNIINISNSNSVINKVIIFDITGKLIIEKFIKQEDESIDLSNIINGLYIILLETNKGNFIYKIIKE